MKRSRDGDRVASPDGVPYYVGRDVVGSSKCHACSTVSIQERSARTTRQQRDTAIHSSTERLLVKTGPSAVMAHSWESSLLDRAGARVVPTDIIPLLRSQGNRIRAGAHPPRTTRKEIVPRLAGVFSLRRVQPRAVGYCDRNVFYDSKVVGNR